MNFSILRKALLSSAALFVSAGAVYATSYTWCGRGETNADGSLNWEDSANWLKDGTTALTAGYPGQTAAGAASTSDYAVFPANYEAYVRVNAANNIYKLDFKNTTHKIILSGVSTNNLLTVNNTIDFSTGAGEIELDNIAVFRSGDITVGPRKLTLKNANFRVNKITMASTAQMALGNGSYCYITQLAPTDNGNNVLSLADGSFMRVQNAATFSKGMTVSLENASTLFVNPGTTFNDNSSLALAGGSSFFCGAAVTMNTGTTLALAGASSFYSVGDFTAYLASGLSLEGKSSLSVNEFAFGNSGRTMLIDDSIVEARSHCYFCNTAPGGGTWTFKGAEPRLVVRGTNFRTSRNANDMTTPVTFDFVVPEGGFLQTPIQHLGNTTTTTFSGSGNIKAGVAFTVNAASPAATAGTQTETPLMISVPGIYGISKPDWVVITAPGTGTLSFRDGSGAGTPAKDADAKMILASVGSGSPAPKPAVAKSDISTALPLAISRKTITASASVTKLSTEAAKTEAVLFVGQRADGADLAPALTNTVVAVGLMPIVWTAPARCFESNYWFKIVLNDIDAGGTVISSCETAVTTARTLDTTDYTWTGGASGNWSDPANWTDNQNGDSLGFPQSAAATARFSAGTVATITLDAAYTVGYLTTQNATDCTTVFVKPADKTQAETKLTVSAGLTLNSTAGSFVMDGVAMQIPSFSLGATRHFIMKNGADLYSTSDCYLAANATIEITEGATASFNGINLQDSNADYEGFFIIDNATVTVRGNVLAPNNNRGATLRLQGKAAKLKLTGNGAHFRSNNANGDAKIEFVIPAGGYDEAPIQGSGAMTVRFGNNGNNAGTTTIAVKVSPDSPALFSDEVTETTLISWATAGINPSMLVLPSGMTGVALNYTADNTELTAAIHGIGHSDRLTVSGNPVNVDVGGVVCGNIDHLSPGFSETYYAPTGELTVSATRKVTLKGWKLYAVNPATGAKTLESSGTNDACAYTHDGIWHELEWQWKVENLVSPAAASNGSVTAPVWCEVGKTAQITATPADGYVFREWQGLGVTDGSEFARVVDVRAEGALAPVAVFDEAVYASPGGLGSGRGTRESPYDLATAISIVGNATDKAVVLLPGIYECAAPLSVTTATRITSESGNPADVIIEPTKNAKGAMNTVNGLVKLTNADARLSSVTINAGTPSSGNPGDLYLENATGYNIVATGITTGSNGSGGGAVHVKNGRLVASLVANNKLSSSAKGNGVCVEGASAVVEYCLITNNTSNAYSTNCGGGAQVISGTLRHCEIRHNQNRAPLGHGGYGGGLYVEGTAESRIEYCLIADNIGGYNAGVTLANKATIVFDHCTVVGNNGMDAPGGLNLSGSLPRVSNCIVWGNRIERTLDPSREELNANSANFIYVSDNCWPVAWGVNALTEDPQYIDAAGEDYRLQPTSPCRALGYGCYPYDESALQVAFPAFSDTTLPAGELSFAAAASGGLGAYSYRWRVDDLNAGTVGEWTVGTADFAETFAPGRYTVTVEVTDGVAATATFSRSFYAGVTDTVYVVPAGTAGNAPLPPYTSEATAANDVNDAINYCAAGGEMLVAPGDYGVTHELYVPRAVNVHASGNAENTSLYRAAPYKSGPSYRVVHLDDPLAILDGFCVSNGFYADAEIRLGANVLSKYATVKNCRITKGYSSINQYAPAAIANLGGLVENCKIFDNYGCGNFGGGMYQRGATAVVRDTEIWNHRSPSAYSYGSGMGLYLEGGLGERLYIHDNYNAYGFGGGTGAGMKLGDAELRNSLISRNQAGANGGGGIAITANGARIINCTIADNAAGQNVSTGFGGGIHGGNYTVTLVNTVFFGNTVTVATPTQGDPDWYNINAASRVENCAFSTSAALLGSTSRVVANPWFTDAANGDYTLDVVSPLIDAGNNWDWTETDIDLAGDPRIQGTKVDIGCYEAEATDTLTCALDIFGNDIAGNDVTVRATPFGSDLNGVEIRVTATATDGTAIFSDWGSALERVFDLAPGRYVFTAEIRNQAGKTGTGSTLAESYVVVPVNAYLVTEEGRFGEPEFPYATWETAATNILDLVSVSGNGTVVSVSNGVHAVSASAVFTSAVTIKSLGGPEKTSFRRVGRDINSGDPMQMIVLGAEGSCISGFLFTNGRGLELDYGAYISANRSTITNCVFTYASLNYNKAGAVMNNGGYCVDCVFTNFTHSGGYGGAYYQIGATAVGERLLIANNGKFKNYYNYGAATVEGGVLKNCVITNNIYESTSNGNRVGGIQLQGGRVENCLVAFNTAGSGAGGIRVSGKNCEIVSCTVVFNSCNGTETTEPRAGGIAVQNGASVAVVNSIVWGNRYLSSNPLSVEDETRDNIAGHALNNNNPVVGTYTTESCWIGGEEPGFKRCDEENFVFDFHLNRYSPCRDIGDNAFVTEGMVDLDGRERIIHKRTDLGCYEGEFIPSATMIIMR